MKKGSETDGRVPIQDALRELIGRMVPTDADTAGLLEAIEELNKLNKRRELYEELSDKQRDEIRKEVDGWYKARSLEKNSTEYRNHLISELRKAPDEGKMENINRYAATLREAKLLYLHLLFNDKKKAEIKGWLRDVDAVAGSREEVGENLDEKLEKELKEELESVIGPIVGELEMANQAYLPKIFEELSKRDKEESRKLSDKQIEEIEKK